MSSRNVRLTGHDRAAAVVLSQSLETAERGFRNGDRSAASIRATVVASIEAEPRASLEYVEVVDIDTLRSVERIDSAVVVLLAAWFGDVRLIDNVVLLDD